MEQTVYIDIFFLINFSMDFLGLFLAARLLGRKISLVRLLLASAFGGAYACAALFFSVSGIISFALDALACVIMAFVAVFERRSWRGIFSFSLVFGAVSILLGGAMTALFYLFNRIGLDKAFGGAQESDGVSVWLFAFLAAVSGIFAARGGRFFKRKSARSRGWLEIEYCKRKVKVPCLCDSGNLLREPISQRPCIVVELEAVSSLFSRSFLKCVKKGDFTELSEREGTRVRMIPARSAAGDAILIGFRVDSVRIDMGRGSCSVDAYIAFSVEKISAEGVKALVPSELVLGAA